MPVFRLFERLDPPDCPRRFKAGRQRLVRFGEPKNGQPFLSVFETDGNHAQFIGAIAIALGTPIHIVAGHALFPSWMDNAAQTTAFHTTGPAIAMQADTVPMGDEEFPFGGLAGHGEAQTPAPPVRAC
jgi:hypothetical protein